jgi:FAD/FMN-containing dehydrogenase
VLLEHQLDLAASVRGQVLDRTHPEYELARAVFNGAIDRRPSLIVRPLDAADVAAAVDFARTSALPLSVRGGGHNVAGHAVCDDGVMVDLRLMREVRVDPVEQIAHAGGGATWNDFDPACQRHGLATPGGTFGTTGVGGLTLGGGLGHLMGRHGLTLDNLLQAEVVTADGQIVMADEQTNSDLFWGLRGGGGNFGVVTRFVFRLHELPPLTGGLLVYDFGRATDVLRGFRDSAVSSPDELTTFSLLARDRASGIRVAMVSVCWTGSSTDARERLDALRALPGLLADGVRPMSYLQLQGVFGEIPFGLRHYWKGHFVGGLPDELIEFLVEHYAKRTSPLGTVLIEPLHGCARRVPDSATAFANRHAAFNLSGISAWESPAEDEEQVAWARTFAEGVTPYSTRGGGYVNYMTRDEPLERVEAAFGAEKFGRLRELKRRYDPGNLFRQNQNIPPADTGVRHR